MPSSSNALAACHACGQPVPQGSSPCANCGAEAGSVAERTVVREPVTRVSADRTLVGEPPPTRAASASEQLIGARLGEYVVKEQIGSGGMGIVYRGEQPVIGKVVAIKVLRPEILETPDHVQRLLREARAVNAIQHRGIIDIFSFGELPDGRQYLVMEYLKGAPLDVHLERMGKLPEPEALGLLEEITETLEAAHTAGVVHRDLKPSNIFLVRHGSKSQYVKLLDFGMAKQGVSKGTSMPQTAVGLWVGTPQYMSPEQVQGDPVGPETDLYSLGVVAFEMVTGRLPFDASNQAQHMLAHVDKEPLVPSEVEPSVSPGLSRLILALLSKQPGQRPTARELLEELRRLGEVAPKGAGSNHPTPPPAAAMESTVVDQKMPPDTSSSEATQVVRSPSQAQQSRGGPRRPAPPRPRRDALPPPPDVEASARTIQMPIVSGDQVTELHIRPPPSSPEPEDFQRQLGPLLVGALVAIGALVMAVLLVRSC